MEDALSATLERFSIASPDLLADRALLRRVDRKYLLASRDLPVLLEALTTGHHLLQAGGRAVARYRTEYFDTPERQSYEDHRRGRRPRCKVRIRHHLDRSATFLEVKRKQPDGRTAKARMACPFGRDELDEPALRFAATHATLPARDLRHTATIEFLRVTLLAVYTDERITIDHAVAMQYGPYRETLQDLAIVEVKQARFSAVTGVMRALRAMRAREAAISKYCVCAGEAGACTPPRFHVGPSRPRTVPRMSDILGMPLTSTTPDMVRLLARLGLDLLVMAIIVRGVYYRRYGERDYIFTYVLLNVVTFCLTYVLSKVPIELGFALGLFAVFGILRYRTEAINVRNLTYLFVVIGVALLNALATDRVALPELLIANALIVAAVAGLEAAPSSQREDSHRILYDRLDLIAPGRAAELLRDLRHRTGLPIARHQIGNIDLLRDTADITVYFRAVTTSAHAPIPSPAEGPPSQPHPESA
jgi:hypothetical protein